MSQKREQIARITHRQYAEVDRWIERNKDSLHGLRLNQIIEKVKADLGIPLSRPTLTELVDSHGIKRPYRKNGTGQSTAEDRVADLEQRMASLELQIAKLQQLVLPLS